MKYVIGYNTTTRDLLWTSELPDTESDDAMDALVADYQERGFDCFWTQGESIMASMDFYVDDNEDIQSRSELGIVPISEAIVGVEQIIEDVPTGTEVFVDGISIGTVDDGSLEISFGAVGSYEVKLENLPEYHSITFTVVATNES